jgi:hypothetical protein
MSAGSTSPTRPCRWDSSAWARSARPAAAAIANAVFHATGKRIRDLPITLDKLI